MSKKIKSEINTDTKTEIKSENKTKIKKTEPKVELKTEPKVELKTEPKVEPKTELKTEPKVEPKTESKLNTNKIDESKFEFNSSGMECFVKGIIVPDEKTPMNSRVIELLSEISKKLDRLITGFFENKKEKVDHINLDELQLSELKFLKELANETIILNRYPGGNQDLVRMSANIVNKIDVEIIDRLKNIS